MSLVAKSRTSLSRRVSAIILLCATRAKSSYPLLNGSFGGNISSFFKTAVIPLFFHPFRTVSLPSAVVRTLYNSINQLACKAFREVSLRLTSMLSAQTPASICFLISSAYQVTNFFLIKFFADPLTVKSSGWKKCVIVEGTFEHSDVKTIQDLSYMISGLSSEHILYQ